MRELSFDGLSPDGTRLILAGKDGQKYTVGIDERLEAAVRRDRARMSQVEIEQSGVLRPREIQARIRAGATAEDVAAASGLSLEHIRRFEGPVLTERAWVAQQAQATEVRRPGGDIELGDLVAERLHSAGVDPADIAWDSWRRDDGIWVVIATFPVPPNTHVATWSYDSVSRTMTVVDENARALSAISTDAPLRLSAPRPLLAPVADLDDDEDEDEATIAVVSSLSGHTKAGRTADEGEAELEAADELEADELHEAESEPDDDSTDAAAAADRAEAAHEPDDQAEPEPAPETADQGPADEAPSDEEPDETPTGTGSGPTADAEDLPLFETPEPSPQRHSGKPSVPSFDDILFGPGPQDH